MLWAITAYFLIFSALAAEPAEARAEDQYVLGEEEVLERSASGNLYARVLVGGVYIYSDRELQSGIFILPATYYVKVRAYAHDACAVTYCFEDYDYARAVYGYVRTSALTFVSTPPGGRSFPNVFPEFEGRGNFYKNTGFDAFYSVTDTPSDAFFYGYFNRGTNKYCYVLSSGKFGYFSADVFGKIDIPLHPDPAPVSRVQETSSFKEESSVESTGTSDDAVKAIIIAAGCVIAVCACYFAFMPFRKKTPLPEDDDY